MEKSIKKVAIALAMLPLMAFDFQFSVAFSQSIQPIYSFVRGPANQIGYNIELTLGPDGNFYGTAAEGGRYGSGTVFQVTTNGVLTILYSFTGGSDGNLPDVALTLGSDGNFYGTTEGGTVFKVTTNGVLTTLVTNLSYSISGFTLGTDGNFYGTASQGNSDGAVFEMTTNGVLTTLASFAGTNGAYPEGVLTLGPDGNFYGTTRSGGGTGDGTVFRVTTNGVLTTLASFAGTNGADPQTALTLGPDGNFYGIAGGGGGTMFKVTTSGVLTSVASSIGNLYLEGSLILGPDGNFYGASQWEGSNGAVFELTTNGVLSWLYFFTGGGDGANPAGELVLGPNGEFYGTTSSVNFAGGGPGGGTVFEVTTNGILTTLVNFGSADGDPARLTLGPGVLYGTTQLGGSNDFGAVFEVTTNGLLTRLHSFNWLQADGSNSGGATPLAALTPGPDGNFYGTTSEGGSNGDGTVFEVTINGVFTALASFANTNGASPEAALTLGPDGNLYGTASSGGSSGDGTVFRVTTNDVLITLDNFAGGNGADPYDALILGPDGNFYGTASGGGSNGNGTVFEVTTNGTLTTLYTFSATVYDETSGLSTNYDGANPYASLILGPDGNFYGTTFYGGSNGNGTVFEVATNGTFTTLHTFALAVYDSANSNNTNNEGAYPYAGLILGPDGSFYGTTFSGGSNGFGTVFKATTNGLLTTLYSFTGGNDGANPYAGLTLGPDGNFYGTTSSGGDGGSGAIYRLDLAPSIIQQPANQSVSSGNEAGFSVTLFGTAPYSFQWLSNGVPILNGTNGTLNISNAITADEARYSVIATNAWGSITSSVANLVVGYAPMIATQPQSVIVTNGALASFTVSATGTPPLSYQWQLNETNLIDGGSFSGSDTTNLIVHPVTTNDVGNYTVIVANSFGSVTSSVANLAVEVPPYIIREPQNVNATNGALANFTVFAGGAPPLLYQWQLNGTNLTDGGAFSGSSTTNLVVVPANTNNAGNYRVIITNGLGSVTSTVAGLVVVMQPYIIREPQNVIVTNGAPASFTVFAAGTPPLSYQWFFNGTNLTDGGAFSGSATTSLSVNRATTNQIGSYAVIVTNDWGSVTSSVAKLTMLLPSQNLFVASQGTVYEFGPSGVGITFASGLFDITALAVNSAGDLFVSDGFGKIYEYTPMGVGSIFPTSLTGVATAMAFSGTNLFVSAGYFNGYIEEIAPNGGLESYFSYGPVGDGLAFNTSGDLFVAVTYSNSIVEIGKNIGQFGQNGQITFASGLDEPEGLAFNSASNLFVANWANGYVYEFTNSFGTLNTNPITFAVGNAPYGLAFDNAGDLFIANQEGNNITEVSTNGTQTTFASNINLPSALAISPPLIPASIQPNVQATATGGTFTFSWLPLNTYPPVGYQIQYTTNLMSGWSNIGSIITNGVTSFTTAIGYNPQNYYRVQIVQ